MRDPAKVVTALVSEVPEGFSVLRHELLAIRDRSAYVPPEGWPQVFALISATLRTHLPWPPKEAWQEVVDEIFSDRKDVGARVS